MNTMETGTFVHTTRDGREVRLHLAGVVDDLTAAGWKLGMGRERWLKWTLVAAEGGDLERIRKQLARELRLPRGRALDRAADMMTAFAVQADLDDADIKDLTTLLCGKRFVLGDAIEEVA